MNTIAKVALIAVIVLFTVLLMGFVDAIEGDPAGWRALDGAE